MTYERQSSLTAPIPLRSPRFIYNFIRHKVANNNSKIYRIETNNHVFADSTLTLPSSLQSSAAASSKLLLWLK